MWLIFISQFASSFNVNMNSYLQVDMNRCEIALRTSTCVTCKMIALRTKRKAELKELCSKYIFWIISSFFISSLSLLTILICNDKHVCINCRSLTRVPAQAVLHNFWCGWRKTQCSDPIIIQLRVIRILRLSLFFSYIYKEKYEGKLGFAQRVTATSSLVLAIAHAQHTAQCMSSSFLNSLLFTRLRNSTAMPSSTAIISHRGEVHDLSLWRGDANCSIIRESEKYIFISSI